MQNAILEKIGKAHMKEDVPELAIGDGVKVHVRIHTKEKPFVCCVDGCPHAFTTLYRNQSHK